MTTKTSSQQKGRKWRKRGEDESPREGRRKEDVLPSATSVDQRAAVSDGEELSPTVLSFDGVEEKIVPLFFMNDTWGFMRRME